MQTKKSTHLSCFTFYTPGAAFEEAAQTYKEKEPFLISQRIFVLPYWEACHAAPQLGTAQDVSGALIFMMTHKVGVLEFTMLKVL